MYADREGFVGGQHNKLVEKPLSSGMRKLCPPCIGIGVCVVVVKELIFRFGVLPRPT